MVQYAFECPDRHETIVRAPMGEAPSRTLCECGRMAHRVYGFHFQEDRTRFFRNGVDGTSFSYSLGTQMPDTRHAYHALLDATGCEPVTPGTMPAQWKENAQYLEHVQHGGEREPPPKPQPTGTTVLQQMRESKTFRVPS
jgi:hypothetical protein